MSSTTEKTKISVKIKKGSAKKSIVAKAVEPKAPTKTLTTLLLDRSYSMNTIRESTVSAINSWIGELRNGGEDIRLSLIMFDTYNGGMCLEKKHVATPIIEVPDLSLNDYVPRGGTPLIDAAYETITAIARSVEGKPCKVVVAIQTDGDEINSKRKWSDLRELIAMKESEGWEFIFMGCGIDAYAQGSKMGISSDKTLSYGSDVASTQMAFRASAANTVAFSSGLKADMAYSKDQKAAAGDIYDRK